MIKLIGQDYKTNKTVTIVLLVFLFLSSLLLASGLRVTGTVLANDLGYDILGLMLSSLGASNVNILIEPLYAFLISPAAQMTLAIVTIFITTKVVKNYHIRNQIQE